MRKNSKNEKVIRAMAIGISAMLMASSPLTALAAEGEGNSSKENDIRTLLWHQQNWCMRSGGSSRKRCSQGCRGAPKRVPLMVKRWGGQHSRLWLHFHQHIQSPTVNSVFWEYDAYTVSKYQITNYFQINDISWGPRFPVVYPNIIGDSEQPASSTTIT